ncbi:hypothetical protein BR93DRAFT_295363 [Coniochaeta sp. PMI_546]|nr:hypothetical protein BR93DRAFT_295363 [Coniochaeta sp. PMI_546]
MCNLQMHTRCRMVSQYDPSCCLSTSVAGYANSDTVEGVGIRPASRFRANAQIRATSNESIGEVEILKEVTGHWSAGPVSRKSLPHLHDSKWDFARPFGLSGSSAHKLRIISSPPSHRLLLSTVQARNNHFQLRHTNKEKTGLTRTNDSGW